eukprot:scaffold218922_cov48-Tisochrysis_lutea.AAC.1
MSHAVTMGYEHVYYYISPHRVPSPVRGVGRQEMRADRENRPADSPISPSFHLSSLQKRISRDWI